MVDDGWTELADRLLEELGDAVAAQGRPEWVEVVDSDPDGRVIRPASRRAGTVGWVAPADCVAVGMVATGRVHALPGADRATERLAGPARLCCVVARDGSVGWTMTAPLGGHPTDPPEEGRMLDCIRRSLGLPTPPPDVSPKALQAVLWLVAIEAAAVMGDTRLTWTQALGLHPLSMGFLWSSELEPVEAVIAAGGAELDWERLRLAAVADGWAQAILSPSEAAWMDDGMFARWVLGEIPDGEALVETVRPLLTASAPRRVSHAVRAAYRGRRQGHSLATGASD